MQTTDGLSLLGTVSPELRRCDQPELTFNFKTSIVACANVNMHSEIQTRDNRELLHINYWKQVSVKSYHNLKGFS